MTSKQPPTDEEMEMEMMDAAEPSTDQVVALDVPQSHISGASLRALPEEAMDSVIRALLLQASSATELRHRAFEAEERAAEAIEQRRWAEGERDRLVIERVNLSDQLRAALVENANLKAAQADNDDALGALSLAMGLLLELAPQDPRLSSLLYRSAQLGVGIKTPLIPARREALSEKSSGVVLPFPGKSRPSPALPGPVEEFPEE